MEMNPSVEKRKVKAIAWKKEAIAWKVFGMRKVLVLEGPAKEEAIAWKVIGVRKRTRYGEEAGVELLDAPGLEKRQILDRVQKMRK